jgi:hypothetical protein
MYHTASQTKFSGGLNLRDGSDVTAPDQAVDALNVIGLPSGGIRQRDGTQRFSAAELTNRPDSLGAHVESDGTRQLMVGNANRIDVLNTAGASIASVAPTASPQSFVRFAAPGSEHTLIANGTDTVRRWDGTVFSTPAYTGTTPTGKFLAVTSTDNRLVCARTASNPDRVLFSDPGLPTTFGANNYEDLHPGSGEAITALVGWNDYVFAFKETEFFYYYGTGTDAQGEPRFNFRHVAGAGSVGAACAAPEGVYFLDRRGVYRTTGGRPELVSSALDPLFLGGSSPFYLGGEISAAAFASARMWWMQGRLYVAFSTNVTNDRLAVFSPLDGWWFLHDIPAAAMTTMRISSREEMVFAYATGLKHIGRHAEGSGLLADDLTTTGTGGTAISSRWHQGWPDYGSQDSKTIRQTKVWGEGSCQVGIARDFALAPGRYDPITFSATVGALWNDGWRWDDGTTWGPSQTTKPWLLSQAVSGTFLSLVVRNSTLNRSWALHRLEHGFREFSRGPEVTRTEAAAA